MPTSSMKSAVYPIENSSKIKEGKPSLIRWPRRNEK